MGKKGKGEGYAEGSFNAALGQVIRLNSILDLCAEYAMTLNLGKWYHTLKQVYREIYPKLTVEERQAYDQKLRQINQSIIKGQAAYSHNGMLTVNSSTYDALNNIDCDLRSIADAHGLLIPEKKTFMDALAMEE